MKSFKVVSIFKDLFKPFCKLGMVGRAIDNNLVNIDVVNPRDFASSNYKSVDDKPYGGGPGAIMSPEIMAQAIKSAKADLSQEKKTKVVYLSPQGVKLDQSKVSKEIEQFDNFVFVSGRYEGIDERVIDKYIDEEWSIGDYILTGGELPVMVAIEALTRLIPGVLNHKDSAKLDSFSSGLLDYPSFTKPIEFEGSLVPEVLLSGNHQKVAKWRKKQALGRTWQRRPDILENYELSQEDKDLLEEYKSEV